MSTYFKNVQSVPYKFGTNGYYTKHQDLSVYVDIIDQVKNTQAFYRKYTIVDGDKPDTLSFRLYGSTAYYWTFFLLNDHLREQGWPLTTSELDQYSLDNYSNTVLTTKDDISSTFTVGKTVVGASSGESAIILERRLEMGQMIVQGDKDFITGELIYLEDDETVTATLSAAEIQYNAVRHYVDSDETIISFDPYTGPGALYAAVTWKENLKNVNDDLKSILVLKPDNIGVLYNEYQKAMKNRYA